MTLPWLDQPVMLHSDRDPGMCMMTPEQCAYKKQYWVFWYQADHRYALPTVAFFLVAIVLFTLGNWATTYTPRGLKQTRGWTRILAAFRLLSYRNWRIAGWSTQSLGALLLAGAGVVFFLAMTLGPHPYYWPNTREISYGDSPPIATRAGFMALACMPFLFVLGAKSSPITALTGISSDKLNVWHNWVAWAMFVLALVHTFPFIVFHIWKGDIVEQWNSGGVWVTGVIALVSQAWLTGMSIPWIRNRYYEFFKVTHYIAAAMFVVFFFIHCDFRMSSWDYFIATGVLYALCWGYAQCKTYFEHGVRHRAVLQRETDHTLKITIETNMTWSPGQHMFLRFLTGGLHMFSTHPFTICSVSRVGQRNTLVFYVRPRGGITGRLMKMAEKSPNVEVPVLMDGPYGGIDPQYSMAAFERSVVVGGGAGAGFTLALVEDFIRRATTYGEKKKTMSGMKVVVATRDPEMRMWYSEALREMAGRYADFDQHPCIEVCFHETGSSTVSPSEAESVPELPPVVGDVPSKEVAVDTTKTHGIPEMFQVTFTRGRPELLAIIEKVVRQEDPSSVGLVVCGPCSMAHDVATAAAVAQQQILSGQIMTKEVFLHQESFTY